MKKNKLKILFPLLLSSLLIGCNTNNITSSSVKNNIVNTEVLSKEYNLKSNNNSDEKFLSDNQNKNDKKDNLALFFDSNDINIDAESEDIISTLQYENIDGTYTNNVVLVSKDSDLSKIDDSNIINISEEDSFYAIQYNNVQDALDASENNPELIKDIPLYLYYDYHYEDNEEDLTRDCEEDISFHLNKTEYMTDFIEKIQGEKDVVVAVLDSGCNENEYSVLSGRVLDGKNFYIDDSNTIQEGTDVSDIGVHHGTMMSSIICSQTPDNVKILPIKIFQEVDNEVVSSAYTLYSGVQYAIDNQVQVINMSLGGESDNEDLINLFREIFIEANENNITVITAAGNESQDVKNCVPACIDEAIVVSAVEKDGKLTNYSNYGDTVDFAGLGDWSNWDLNNWGEGTSEACAYVSSVYANLYSGNTDFNEYNEKLSSLAGNWEEENGYENIFYGNGVLSPYDKYFSCYTEPNLFSTISLLKIDNSLSDSELQDRYLSNQNAINSITSQFGCTVEDFYIKVGKAYRVRDYTDSDKNTSNEYVNNDINAIQFNTYKDSSLTEKTNFEFQSGDKFYIGKIFNNSVLLCFEPVSNKNISQIDINDSDIFAGWINFSTLRHIASSQVNSDINFYLEMDKNNNSVISNCLGNLSFNNLDSDNTYIVDNSDFIYKNVFEEYKFHIGDVLENNPNNTFYINSFSILGGQDKDVIYPFKWNDIVLKNNNAADIHNYIDKHTDSIVFPSDCVINEKGITVFSDKPIHQTDSSLYFAGDTFKIFDDLSFYTYSPVISQKFCLNMDIPDINTDISSIAFTAPSGSNYSFDSDICGIYDTSGQKITSTLNSDTDYILKIGLKSTDFEKYLFSKNIEISVNDDKNINLEKNNCKEIIFTYDFHTEKQNTKLGSVTLSSFDGPEYNQDLSAPIQTSNNNKCIIENPYFMRNETIADEELALPDTVYTVYYKIKPAEGYYFDENTIIKFGDLGNMNTTYDSVSGSILASWTFEKTQSSPVVIPSHNLKVITDSTNIKNVEENEIIYLSEYIVNKDKYIPTCWKIYQTDNSSDFQYYSLDDDFNMPTYDCTIELLYELQLSLLSDLPVEKTIKEDNEITLSVETNLSSVSYKWYVDKNDGNNFQLIEGEINSSYTFTPSLNDNNNQYYCIISTDYQSINSKKLLLTVEQKENEPEKDKQYNLYQNDLDILKNTVNYNIVIPDNHYTSYDWYTKSTNNEDYVSINNSSNTYAIDAVDNSLNGLLVKCIASNEEVEDTYIYKLNVYQNENIYTITIQNNENGQVFSNYLSAKENTIINIDAIANNGYKFEKWDIISGNITLEDIYQSPTSFVLTDNVILKAYFIEDKKDSDNAEDNNQDNYKITFLTNEYQLNSDNNICFYIENKEKEDILKIQIDGNDLLDTDFSIIENKDEDFVYNTENEYLILISNNFLNTLSVDNHVLSVIFTDNQIIDDFFIITDKNKNEENEKDIYEYKKNKDVLIKWKSATNIFDSENDNELSVNIEKNIDDFDFITINGINLSSDDFNISPDDNNNLSLIISKDYLNNLPTGKYIIKVYFTDKEYIETTFSVYHPSETKEDLFTENPVLKLDFINHVYILQSNKNMISFTIKNIKSSDINCILIDNSVVKSGYNIKDLENNEIQIDLLYKFLNTLSSGSHKIKILYSDNTFTVGNIVIKENKTNNMTNNELEDKNNTNKNQNNQNSETNTNLDTNNKNNSNTTVSNTGNEKTTNHTTEIKQNSINNTNQGSSDNNTSSNVYNKDKGDDVNTGDASNIILLISFCSLCILYLLKKKIKKI